MKYRKMFDYITADTHFAHNNINTYEPSRISKAQMKGYRIFDKYMIDEWNDKVKDNDNILHLGDVAFKEGYLEAKKLKGNITLLIGNHDKFKHIDYYRSLGWKIIDTLKIELKDISENERYEFNNLLYRMANQNGHNLTAGLVAEYNGKRILFSHFPVFNDNPYDDKYKVTTNILEELYLLFDCYMNIHGHTHSAGAKEKFCESACLEMNDFKLVRLEQLLGK